MRSSKPLAISLLFMLMLDAGCARAARDTSGFAVIDTIDVNAPTEQVWLATRDTLREMDFDIYTRDKKGLFVAYAGEKRRWMVPYRTKHTLVIEPLTAISTRITAETVDQVYGVTLLTHPGWHDRKTTDNSRTLEVLQAVSRALETSP